MKNNKKWQFPKISRFITEAKNKLDWEQKKYLIYVFTAVFILFIAFMVFDLSQKILIIQNLKTEREQVLKDINKWEKVVQKYKDYKDGYLQLAILEYKMGDLNKAKTYLNNALNIDPNYIQGRDLETILQKY